MIRVALVDDYCSLRDAMKHFLALWEDVEVVLEAADGKDLLDRLCVSCDMPDVVVMDVQMPIMDGYQATRYLSLHYPFIKVLGMSADEEVGNRIMDCGAAGFLPKGVDGDKIVEAIYALGYQ
jgi:DNA-binding NarL/FixJ family response regulator